MVEFERLCCAEGASQPSSPIRDSDPRAWGSRDHANLSAAPGAPQVFLPARTYRMSLLVYRVDESYPLCVRTHEQVLTVCELMRAIEDDSHSAFESEYEWLLNGQELRKDTDLSHASNTLARAVDPPCGCPSDDALAVQRIPMCTRAATGSLSDLPAWLTTATTTGTMATTVTTTHATAVTHSRERPWMTAPIERSGSPCGSAPSANQRLRHPRCTLRSLRLPRVRHRSTSSRCHGLPRVRHRSTPSHGRHRVARAARSAVWPTAAAVT